MHRRNESWASRQEKRLRFVARIAGVVRSGAAAGAAGGAGAGGACGAGGGGRGAGGGRRSAAAAAWPAARRAASTRAAALAGARRKRPVSDTSASASETGFVFCWAAADAARSQSQGLRILWLFSKAVQIMLTLAIPRAAVTRGSVCHATRRRTGLPSLRRMQPARRRAMRSRSTPLES